MGIILSVEGHTHTRAAQWPDQPGSRVGDSAADRSVLAPVLQRGTRFDPAPNAVPFVNLGSNQLRAAVVLTRNAPLTLLIALAEPVPKEFNNPDDIRDGINWAEQTFGADDIEGPDRVRTWGEARPTARAVRAASLLSQRLVWPGFSLLQ